MGYKGNKGSSKANDIGVDMGEDSSYTFDSPTGIVDRRTGRHLEDINELGGFSFKDGGPELSDMRYFVSPDEIPDKSNIDREFEYKYGLKPEDYDKVDFVDEDENDFPNDFYDGGIDF